MPRYEKEGGLAFWLTVAIYLFSTKYGFTWLGFAWFGLFMASYLYFLWNIGIAIDNIVQNYKTLLSELIVKSNKDLLLIKDLAYFNFTSDEEAVKKMYELRMTAYKILRRDKEDLDKKMKENSDKILKEME